MKVSGCTPGRTTADHALRVVGVNVIWRIWWLLSPSCAGSMAEEPGRPYCRELILSASTTRALRTGCPLRAIGRPSNQIDVRRTEYADRVRSWNVRGATSDRHSTCLDRLASGTSRRPLGSCRATQSGRSCRELQELPVTTGALALVLATFLASAVETVEALTIVLAVGVTRGWRSTTAGIAAALAALTVLVAVVGRGLTAIPIDVLRLAVGGLLLIFGLQWLRKAILRASGLKEIHDEVAIFAREAAEARARPPVDPRAFDAYAFTLSFKGVFLEGLEVAFIVLTFGATQGSIPLAAVGAAAAVLLVTAVGIAARAPLARIPENTLKFAVGVLLTSFGMFWGAEGAGVSWPGNDAALPVIVLVTAVSAIGSVFVLRSRPIGTVTGAS
jgi:uncharacterized membrane protein